MANPLRKTLEFLGLAEESYEDDQHQQQQRQPHAGTQAPAQRATVTPLRRGGKSQGMSDVNEILTVHPKKYDDARVIAETFREGIPVIINLTQMSESEARRLVDFSSGLAQGLRGHIERVTPKVFLLSPSHVHVSGDGDGLESEVDASLTD
jgi:cell division inhibitor SepF